jgi:ABC-type phosphate/phosphonate transport system substrate-binding protein
LLLAAGCWAAGWQEALAAKRPLRFGIVPYLTARRLATLYEPARAFFERQLAQTVHIQSAPDYTVHLERLREREYDLVADSLPVARLAQRELGYIPIARTRIPLLPVIAVAADSPVRKLDDLRGQSIVVSDRVAALTIVGLRYLRDQGLRPNVDVTLRVAGSHANALQRVLAGEAVAAVISRTTLKQVEPALSSRMKILIDLPPALSAVVYTVSPALADQAAELAQSLIRFTGQDPAGKAFIEALGHQGLLPAGSEMAQVDPLVVEFYRQLNHTE